MLNTVTLSGPDTLPALLIVHGLFGSARNWGVIAKKLSATRTVHAVDMRNHGDSPRGDSHTYADMAQDLGEVIAALGGPMDVLGHSMGGKAAMVLALTQPTLVNRLIVADIAPMAYGHTQMPLIDAMQELDIKPLKSRRDADTALSATVEDPGVRAFLLQSLDLRASPPAWKLSLEVLRQDMPHILGWPGTEGRFEGGVLFLFGGASNYVTDAIRPVVRGMFPNVAFSEMPGVGHWLHAEAPGPFLEEVAGFLR